MNNIDKSNPNVPENDQNWIEIVVMAIIYTLIFSVLQKGSCSPPHPKLLMTKFVPIIMFHMLSELSPLSIADTVLRAWQRR